VRLLQDAPSNALLGSQPLQQALLQRPSVAALLPPHAAAAAAPASPAAAQQPPPPFALEQGVSTAALLLLSRSSLARQRDLAGQLLRQLARVATALQQSGAGGGGAAPAPVPAHAGLPGERRTSPTPAPAASMLAADGTPSRGGSCSLPPEAPSPEGGQAGAVRRRGSTPDAGGSASQQGPARMRGSTPDAGGSASKRRTFGAFGSARAARPGQRASSTDTAPPAAAAAGADAGAGGGAGAAAAAGAVGSDAAVQVSVWLRLAVLMPLLPIVRANRDQEGARNLRGRACTVLAQLMTCSQLAGSFLEPSEAGGAGDGVAPAAATAAMQLAGQSLMQRLQAVLAALSGGAWPGWLSGGNTRLREVGAWEGAKQLAAELSGKEALAEGVLSDILSALPIGLQPAERAGAVQLPEWLPWEGGERAWVAAAMGAVGLQGAPPPPLDG
jgi:hypothetical protein